MTGARWKLPLMWSPDHRTKWVASTHPPAVRSDIRERGGANVRKANLKLPHERQQLKVRNGRTPVSLCESTSGRCTLKADVDVALGRRAAMGRTETFVPTRERPSSIALQLCLSHPPACHLAACSGCSQTIFRWCHRCLAGRGRRPRDMQKPDLHVAAMRIRPWLRKWSCARGTRRTGA
jgi:hypothetical protein